MPDDSKTIFSDADAKAFAARYGLARLNAEDLVALRAAMERSLTAGLNVPRVASKFDAPAPVFSVSEIAG
jgi:hypothetical protein